MSDHIPVPFIFKEKHMRSVEIIGENRTDRTCPGGVVIFTF